MADLAQYAHGMAANGQAELAGTVALSGSDVHVNGLLTILGKGLGSDKVLLWPYWDQPVIAQLPAPPYGADPLSPPVYEFPEYPQDRPPDFGAVGTGTGGLYLFTSVAESKVQQSSLVEAGYSAGNPWGFRVVSFPCYTLLLAFYPREGQIISFDLRWANGGGPGGVAGGIDPDPGEVVVTPGGGREMSKSELVALYARHNFPDPNLTAAIALAESGGDPSAINTSNEDGSVDRGLLQINSVHAQYIAARLFEPDYNAQAGYDISSGGTDYTPWVTFNTGAYIPFL